LRLQLSGTVQDLIGNAVATPVLDDATYIFAGGEAPKSNISLVNSAQGFDIGGEGQKTLVSGFDASGADKLVVVVGAEHGFGGNIGGQFTSMTYSGQTMTLVIQEEAGIPTAAIFYLDNPAAVSPGDIKVNQGNHNGTIFRAYALSGTAPGVGVSYKSTSNPSSFDLITAASESWVIAGVLNAGPNGGNNATNMSAALPLVENPLSDLESGSRWVSMCFATAEIATPGHGVYSFSGANATDLLATVGVEIPAAEYTGGSPYTPWASTNAPTTGNDPSADEDSDGVNNGVEFVVGGTITTNDLDKLPTLATDGTDVTFAFVRNQDSIDASVALSIEVGTDLATWPTSYAVPDADTEGIVNPGVTVVSGATTDTVTLRIPQDSAKKFARLKVAVTP
jgi:hypothetical protein